MKPFPVYITTMQARREGGVAGVSYPGPRDVWGVPSAKNIKYARMYHMEKIQKFFPQRDPVKMFGGPTRMFPQAPLRLSTGLLGLR